MTKGSTTSELPGGLTRSTNRERIGGLITFDDETQNDRCPALAQQAGAVNWPPYEIRSATCLARAMATLALEVRDAISHCFESISPLHRPSSHQGRGVV